MNLETTGLFDESCGRRGRSIVDWEFLKMRDMFKMNLSMLGLIKVQRQNRFRVLGEDTMNYIKEQKRGLILAT